MIFVQIKNAFDSKRHVDCCHESDFGLVYRRTDDNRPNQMAKFWFWSVGKILMLEKQSLTMTRCLLFAEIHLLNVQLDVICVYY